MRADPGRRSLRVGTRNATFQHWETLLRNRTKRHRARQFLIQGVRPITVAIEQNWSISALILVEGGPLSQWAQHTWSETRAQRYELAPELFAALSDKEDGTGELLAVVDMPADDLSRVDPRPYSPLVVFDRPAGPGNVGTLVRSVDAFGGAGLVVTGHAADPYDPKAVRASTGSIFTVPVVRVDAPSIVLDKIAALRSDGADIQVLGTDEGGALGVRDVGFAVPTVLVVGNEARGLAKAWREGCDAIVSIPMIGEASSLNAATAGSILLHESLQQGLAAQREQVIAAS